MFIVLVETDVFPRKFRALAETFIDRQEAQNCADAACKSFRKRCWLAEVPEPPLLDEVVTVLPKTDGRIIKP